MPLVALTSSRKLMGDLVNRRRTILAGIAAGTLVIALNCFLLVRTLTPG